MRYRYTVHRVQKTCALRVVPTGGERLDRRLDALLSHGELPEVFCARTGTLCFDVSGLKDFRHFYGRGGPAAGMVAGMLADLADALRWLRDGWHARLAVPFGKREVLVTPDAHLRFVAAPLSGFVPCGKSTALALLEAIGGREARGATPDEEGLLAAVRGFVDSSRGACSTHRLLSFLDGLSLACASGVSLCDTASGEGIRLVSGVTYLMGRAPDCDVRIADAPYVSRHHARVKADATGVKVCDLGSSNGVTVKGCHVRPYEEVHVGFGGSFALAGRRFEVGGDAPCGRMGRWTEDGKGTSTERMVDGYRDQNQRAGTGCRRGRLAWGCGYVLRL